MAVLQRKVRGVGHVYAATALEVWKQDPGLHKYGSVPGRAGGDSLRSATITCTVAQTHIDVQNQF